MTFLAVLGALYLACVVVGVGLLLAMWVGTVIQRRRERVLGARRAIDHQFWSP